MLVANLNMYVADPYIEFIAKYMRKIHCSMGLIRMNDVKCPGVEDLPIKALRACQMENM